MRLSLKTSRILHFDIENRPLSYYGGDLTTAEVTAIAASFAGSDEMHCWVLPDDDPQLMLEGFRGLYNQADIVTGHYIRRHDLPLLNGAYVEYGLPVLDMKLTSDTKLDLVKWSFETQPKSQEELALTLGLMSPKVRMTQHDWRSANRFENVKLTKARVVSDVVQHKELRKELLVRGLLGPPRTWRP